MLFQTERTRVFLLSVDHAELLSAYFRENESHLAAWEPLRSDGYHSKREWMQRAIEYQREQEEGRSLRLLAFDRNEDVLLGVCFFSNIVRGVFQACHTGYSTAEKYCGQGLMTEMLGHSVDYVFRELHLHRVMSNYIPENHASARVLQKLGFEREGYARSYLQIAGRWRDHVLTSKLNPAQEDL